MFSEMQRERADMLVRRKYKKYSKQKVTYLGLIAYVIQKTPEKRLTFCELMNAVTTFVEGDKKGLENNIRVCLSSNNCFVKEPVNPECPNAKRNFWKLDESKITPKMLRRHFNGLRQAFPGFYENVENSPAKITTGITASSKGRQTEKKFTSSFSIESLLQRDTSAPVRHKPAHCTSTSAVLDLGLACKRKTWNWPNPPVHANFSGSHFYFPSYTLGQVTDGYGPYIGPNKRMQSELYGLSYFHCTNIKPYTANSVTWPNV